MNPRSFPPSNQYAEERGLHEAHESFREESRSVPLVLPHAPPPGEEVSGPALFELYRKTAHAVEVQNELLRAAIPLMDRRIIVEYKTGQTDANGNADIVIYQVPQGMQFITTRVNVEDATHTPASPYTNAAGWIALIRGQAFAPGCIVDFIPNPPLTNGPILPASITDGATEAGVFRGGEFVTLHVAGAAALATTDIWVRLQGIQEPI